MTSTKENNRKEIERQMTEKNMTFIFSGISEVNGLSIYYKVLVDGEYRKFRFSGHSVSNSYRMQNEEHYPLPIKTTLNSLKERRAGGEMSKTEILKLF